MPFIFMTGYSDPETVQQVKLMGSVEYITKPFDLEDLVELVRTVFRRMNQ